MAKSLVRFLIVLPMSLSDLLQPCFDRGSETSEHKLLNLDDGVEVIEDVMLQLPTGGVFSDVVKVTDRYLALRGLYASSSCKSESIIRLAISQESLTNEEVHEEHRVIPASGFPHVESLGSSSSELSKEVCVLQGSGFTSLDISFPDWAQCSSFEKRVWGDFSNSGPLRICQIPIVRKRVEPDVRGIQAVKEAVTKFLDVTPGCNDFDFKQAAEKRTFYDFISVVEDETLAQENQSIFPGISRKKLTSSLIRISQNPSKRTVQGRKRKLWGFEITAVKKCLLHDWEFENVSSESNVDPSEEPRKAKAAFGRAQSLAHVALLFRGPKTTFALPWFRRSPLKKDWEKLDGAIQLSKSDSGWNVKTKSYQTPIERLEDEIIFLQFLHPVDCFDFVAKWAANPAHSVIDGDDNRGFRLLRPTPLSLQPSFAELLGSSQKALELDKKNGGPHVHSVELRAYSNIVPPSFLKKASDSSGGCLLLNTYFSPLERSSVFHLRQTSRFLPPFLWKHLEHLSPASQKKLAHRFCLPLASIKFDGVPCGDESDIPRSEKAQPRVGNKQALVRLKSLETEEASSFGFLLEDEHRKRDDLFWTLGKSASMPLHFTSLQECQLFTVHFHRLRQGSFNLVLGREGYVAGLVDEGVGFGAKLTPGFLGLWDVKKGHTVERISQVLPLVETKGSRAQLEALEVEVGTVASCNAVKWRKMKQTASLGISYRFPETPPISISTEEATAFESLHMELRDSPFRLQGLSHARFPIFMLVFGSTASFEEVVDGKDMTAVEQCLAMMDVLEVFGRMEGSTTKGARAMTAFHSKNPDALPPWTNHMFLSAAVIPIFRAQAEDLKMDLESPIPFGDVSSGIDAGEDLTALLRTGDLFGPSKRTRHVDIELRGNALELTPDSFATGMGALHVSFTILETREELYQEAHKAHLRFPIPPNLGIPCVPSRGAPRVDQNLWSSEKSIPFGVASRFRGLCSLGRNSFQEDIVGAESLRDWFRVPTVKAFNFFLSETDETLNIMFDDEQSCLAFMRKLKDGGAFIGRLFWGFSEPVTSIPPLGFASEDIRIAKSKGPTFPPDLQEEGVFDARRDFWDVVGFEMDVEKERIVIFGGRGLRIPLSLRNFQEFPRIEIFKSCKPPRPGEELDHPPFLLLTCTPRSTAAEESCSMFEEEQPSEAIRNLWGLHDYFRFSEQHLWIYFPAQEPFNNQACDEFVKNLEELVELQKLSLSLRRGTEAPWIFEFEKGRFDVAYPRPVPSFIPGKANPASSPENLEIYVLPRMRALEKFCTPFVACAPLAVEEAALAEPDPLWSNLRFQKKKCEARCLEPGSDFSTPFFWRGEANLPSSLRSREMSRERFEALISGSVLRSLESDFWVFQFANLISFPSYFNDFRDAVLAEHTKVIDSGYQGFEELVSFLTSSMDSTSGSTDCGSQLLVTIPLDIAQKEVEIRQTLDSAPVGYENLEGDTRMERLSGQNLAPKLPSNSYIFPVRALSVSDSLIFPISRRSIHPPLEDPLSAPSSPGGSWGGSLLSSNPVINTNICEMLFHRISDSSIFASLMMAKPLETGLSSEAADQKLYLTPHGSAVFALPNSWVSLSPADCNKPGLRLTTANNRPLAVLYGTKLTEETLYLLAESSNLAINIQVSGLILCSPVGSLMLAEREAVITFGGSQAATIWVENEKPCRLRPPGEGQMYVLGEDNTIILKGEKDNKETKRLTPTFTNPCPTHLDHLLRRLKDQVSVPLEKVKEAHFLRKSSLPATTSLKYSSIEKKSVSHIRARVVLRGGMALVRGIFETWVHLLAPSKAKPLTVNIESVGQFDLRRFPVSLRCGDGEGVKDLTTRPLEHEVKEESPSDTYMIIWDYVPFDEVSEEGLLLLREKKEKKPGQGIPLSPWRDVVLAELDFMGDTQACRTFECALSASNPSCELQRNGMSYWPEMFQFQPPMVHVILVHQWVSPDDNTLLDFMPTPGIHYRNKIAIRFPIFMDEESKTVFAGRETDLRVDCNFESDSGKLIFQDKAGSENVAQLFWEPWSSLGRSCHAVDGLLKSKSRIGYVNLRQHLLMKETENLRGLSFQVICFACFKRRFVNDAMIKAMNSEFISLPPDSPASAYGDEFWKQAVRNVPSVAEIVRNLNSRETYIPEELSLFFTLAEEPLNGNPIVVVEGGDLILFYGLTKAFWAFKVRIPLGSVGIYGSCGIKVPKNFIVLDPTGYAEESNEGLDSTSSGPLVISFDDTMSFAACSTVYASLNLGRSLSLLTEDDMKRFTREQERLQARNGVSVLGVNDAWRFDVGGSPLFVDRLTSFALVNLQCLHPGLISIDSHTKNENFVSKMRRAFGAYFRKSERENGAKEELEEDVRIVVEEQFWTWGMDILAFHVLMPGHASAPENLKSPEPLSRSFEALQGKVSRLALQNMDVGGCRRSLDELIWASFSSKRDTDYSETFVTHVLVRMEIFSKDGNLQKDAPANVLSVAQIDTEKLTIRLMDGEKLVIQHKEKLQAPRYEVADDLCQYGGIRIRIWLEGGSPQFVFTFLTPFHGCKELLKQLTTVSLDSSTDSLEKLFFAPPVLPTLRFPLFELMHIECVYPDSCEEPSGQRNDIGQFGQFYIQPGLITDVRSQRNTHVNVFTGFSLVPIKLEGRPFTSQEVVIERKHPYNRLMPFSAQISAEDMKFILRLPRDTPKGEKGLNARYFSAARESNGGTISDVCLPTLTPRKRFFSGGWSPEISSGIEDVKSLSLDVVYFFFVLRLHFNVPDNWVYGQQSECERFLRSMFVAEAAMFIRMKEEKKMFLGVLGGTIFGGKLELSSQAKEELEDVPFLDFKNFAAVYTCNKKLDPPSDIREIFPKDLPLNLLIQPKTMNPIGLLKDSETGKYLVRSIRISGEIACPTIYGLSRQIFTVRWERRQNLNFPSSIHALDSAECFFEGWAEKNTGRVKISDLEALLLCIPHSALQSEKPGDLPVQPSLGVLGGWDWETQDWRLVLERCDSSTIFVDMRKAEAPGGTIVVCQFSGGDICYQAVEVIRLYRGGKHIRRNLFDLQVSELIRDSFVIEHIISRIDLTNEILQIAEIKGTEYSYYKSKTSRVKVSPHDLSLQVIKEVEGGSEAAGVYLGTMLLQTWDMCTSSYLKPSSFIFYFIDNIMHLLRFPDASECRRFSDIFFSMKRSLIEKASSRHISVPEETHLELDGLNLLLTTDLSISLTSSSALQAVSGFSTSLISFRVAAKTITWVTPAFFKVEGRYGIAPIFNELSTISPPVETSLLYNRLDLEYFNLLRSACIPLRNEQRAVLLIFTALDTRDEQEVFPVLAEVFSSTDLRVPFGIVAENFRGLQSVNRLISVIRKEQKRAKNRYHLLLGPVQTMGRAARDEERDACISEAGNALMRMDFDPLRNRNQVRTSVSRDRIEVLSKVSEIQIPSGFSVELEPKSADEPPPPPLTDDIFDFFLEKGILSFKVKASSSPPSSSPSFLKNLDFIDLTQLLWGGDGHEGCSLLQDQAVIRLEDDASSLGNLLDLDGEPFGTSVWQLEDRYSLLLRFPSMEACQDLETPLKKWVRPTYMEASLEYLVYEQGEDVEYDEEPYSTKQEIFCLRECRVKVLTDKLRVEDFHSCKEVRNTLCPQRNKFEKWISTPPQENFEADFSILAPEISLKGRGVQNFCQPAVSHEVKESFLTLLLPASEVLYSKPKQGTRDFFGTLKVIFPHNEENESKCIVLSERAERYGICRDVYLSVWNLQDPKLFPSFRVLLPHLQFLRRSSAVESSAHSKSSVFSVAVNIFDRDNMGTLKRRFELDLELLELVADRCPIDATLTLAVRRGSASVASQTRKLASGDYLKLDFSFCGVEKRVSRCSEFARAVPVKSQVIQTLNIRESGPPFLWASSASDDLHLTLRDFFITTSSQASMVMDIKTSKELVTQGELEKSYFSRRVSVDSVEFFWAHCEKVAASNLVAIRLRFFPGLTSPQQIDGFIEADLDCKSFQNAMSQVLGWPLYIFQTSSSLQVHGDMQDAFLHVGDHFPPLRVDYFKFNGAFLMIALAEAQNLKSEAGWSLPTSFLVDLEPAAVEPTFPNFCIRTLDEGKRLYSNTFKVFDWSASTLISSTEEGASISTLHFCRFHIEMTQSPPAMERSHIMLHFFSASTGSILTKKPLIIEVSPPLELPVSPSEHQGYFVYILSQRGDSGCSKYAFSSHVYDYRGYITHDRVSVGLIKNIDLVSYIRPFGLDEERLISTLSPSSLEPLPFLRLEINALSLDKCFKFLNLFTASGVRDRFLGLARSVGVGGYKTPFNAVTQSWLTHSNTLSFGLPQELQVVSLKQSHSLEGDFTVGSVQVQGIKTETEFTGAFLLNFSPHSHVSKTQDYQVFSRVLNVFTNMVQDSCKVSRSLRLLPLLEWEEEDSLCAKDVVNSPELCVQPGVDVEFSFPVVEGCELMMQFLKPYFVSTEDDVFFRIFQVILVTPGENQLVTVKFIRSPRRAGIDGTIAYVNVAVLVETADQRAQYGMNIQDIEVGPAKTCFRDQFEEKPTLSINVKRGREVIPNYVMFGSKRFYYVGSNFHFAFHHPHQCITLRRNILQAYKKVVANPSKTKKATTAAKIPDENAENIIASEPPLQDAPISSKDKSPPTGVAFLGYVSVLPELSDSFLWIGKRTEDGISALSNFAQGKGFYVTPTDIVFWPFFLRAQSVSLFGIDVLYILGYNLVMANLHVWTHCQVQPESPHQFHILLTNKVNLRGRLKLSKIAELSPISQGRYAYQSLNMDCIFKDLPLHSQIRLFFSGDSYAESAQVCERFVDALRQHQHASLRRPTFLLSEWRPRPEFQLPRNQPPGFLLSSFQSAGLGEEQLPWLPQREFLDTEEVHIHSGFVVLDPAAELKDVNSIIAEASKFLSVKLVCDGSSSALIAVSIEAANSEKATPFVKQFDYGLRCLQLGKVIYSHLPANLMNMRFVSVTQPKQRDDDLVFHLTAPRHLYKHISPTYALFVLPRCPSYSRGFSKFLVHFHFLRVRDCIFFMTALRREQVNILDQEAPMLRISNLAFSHVPTVFDIGCFAFLKNGKIVLLAGILSYCPVDPKNLDTFDSLTSLAIRVFTVDSTGEKLKVLVKGDQVTLQVRSTFSKKDTVISFRLLPKNPVPPSKLEQLLWTSRQKTLAVGTPDMADYFEKPRLPVPVYMMDVPPDRLLIEGLFRILNRAAFRLVQSFEKPPSGYETREDLRQAKRGQKYDLQNLDNPVEQYFSFPSVQDQLGEKNAFIEHTGKTVIPGWANPVDRALLRSTMLRALDIFDAMNLINSISEARSCLRHLWFFIQDEQNLQTQQSGREYLFLATKAFLYGLVEIGIDDIQSPYSVYMSEDRLKLFFLNLRKSTFPTPTFIPKDVLKFKRLLKSSKGKDLKMEDLQTVYGAFFMCLTYYQEVRHQMDISITDDAEGPPPLRALVPFLSQVPLVKSEFSLETSAFQGQWVWNFFHITSWWIYREGENLRQATSPPKSFQDIVSMAEQFDEEDRENSRKPGHRIRSDRYTAAEGKREYSIFMFPYAVESYRNFIRDFLLGGSGCLSWKADYLLRHSVNDAFVSSQLRSTLISLIKKKSFVDHEIKRIVDTFMRSLFDNPHVSPRSKAYPLLPLYPFEWLFTSSFSSEGSSNFVTGFLPKLRSIKLEDPFSLPWFLVKLHNTINKTAQRHRVPLETESLQSHFVAGFWPLSKRFAPQKNRRLKHGVRGVSKRTTEASKLSGMLGYRADKHRGHNSNFMRILSDPHSFQVCGFAAESKEQGPRGLIRWDMWAPPSLAETILSSSFLPTEETTPKGTSDPKPENAYLYNLRALPPSKYSRTTELKSSPHGAGGLSKGAVASASFLEEVAEARKVYRQRKAKDTGPTRVLSSFAQISTASDNGNLAGRETCRVKQNGLTGHSERESGLTRDLRKDTEEASQEKSIQFSRMVKALIEEKLSKEEFDNIAALLDIPGKLKSSACNFLQKEEQLKEALRSSGLLEVYGSPENELVFEAMYQNQYPSDKVFLGQDVYASPQRKGEVEERNVKGYLAFFMKRTRVLNEEFLKMKGDLNTETSQFLPQTVWSPYMSHWVHLTSIPNQLKHETLRKEMRDFLEDFTAVSPIEYIQHSVEIAASRDGGEELNSKAMRMIEALRDSVEKES